MVEKIGTIKNPLSIIAIFAAIAEISGTVVLPFIAVQNQALYVWFLMIFPTLLVVIFFLTLNFNHRVLYAPSDYGNEDNFVRLLSKANSSDIPDELKELLEKLTIEVGKITDKLPKETVKQVTFDLNNLIEESTNPSSRKTTHYQASLQGIKDATESLGEVSQPILEIAKKLSPLLGL